MMDPYREVFIGIRSDAGNFGTIASHVQYVVFEVEGKTEGYKLFCPRVQINANSVDSVCIVAGCKDGTQYAV